MITNDLQMRIHLGDREAFHAVYNEYGPACTPPPAAPCTRKRPQSGRVKQTFFAVTMKRSLPRRTILTSPCASRELAEKELLLIRFVSGDVDASALQCESCPDPETLSARGAFPPGRTRRFELSPLEREIAKRKPSKSVFTHSHRKELEKERKRGRFWRVLSILILLLLLWVLAGVLMASGYLPAIDLGYGWFSRTVFPLFPFGA
jgi:predicted nucleic acid-binding Zn ribbon protein